MKTLFIKVALVVAAPGAAAALPIDALFGALSVPVRVMQEDWDCVLNEIESACINGITPCTALPNGHCVDGRAGLNYDPDLWRIKPDTNGDECYCFWHN